MSVLSKREREELVSDVFGAICDHDERNQIVSSRDLITVPFGSVSVDVYPMVAAGLRSRIKKLMNQYFPGWSTSSHVDFQRITEDFFDGDQQPGLLFMAVGEAAGLWKFNTSGRVYEVTQ